MPKFLDEKPVEMSFPKKNGVFIPPLGVSCLEEGKKQVKTMKFRFFLKSELTAKL